MNETPAPAPLSLAEAPQGPSTARVVWLIARLSLVRFINRLAGLLGRRPRPGERTATARKPATGRFLLACFGVFFALQSVQITTRLVHQIALSAERRADPERLVLDAASFWRLQAAPPERLEEEFRQTVQRQTLSVMNDAERTRREELLWRTFREQGLGGFRQSELPPLAFWPAAEVWYGAGDPLEMLRPLAVVGFLLGLAQVLQHVAGSDDDLARVGAGLEWLFSFPVPARSLFLARALSAVLTGPLIWVLVFPFYCVVFCCAGFGTIGIVLAAGAAIYVALLGGGLRVLLETALRRYLPLPWVSRIQALLLTLSVVAMVAAAALTYSGRTDLLSDTAARLPAAVFYAPLSLPLRLVLGGNAALGVGLVSLPLALGWIAFAVWTAERMVRPGLTSGGGPLVARRGQPETIASRSGWNAGSVWRKELRALFRDRRLRAQAFLSPLLVFGLQLWLNPSLLDAIRRSPRHIATAAFAVGAFTLTTGACSALATEGPALWMLYTLPERLERLLFQKLRVWLGVACFFAAIVLGMTWSRAPGLIIPTLPYAALAALGLCIYSVIALGIGSLGTNPLELEPRRRIRPGELYLFMLLAGLYAYAIYVPSWWAKGVQLVLSALLAFALWQKLRDQLPYLLDPTEAPAPEIAVADGIFAALAFFVLQGVFGLIFGSREGSEGRTLLFGFSLAGISVTLVALYALWRSGVPRLLSKLGLVRRPGETQSRLLQIGLGVGGGLAAGLVGFGYRLLARHIDWLGELFEHATDWVPDDGDAGPPLWFFALAVIAAPLFEEFIFRGILYRGLRRSLGAPVAVLASALVFALVHPAVAAFPVFVMALLAAAAYERTGWLLTPMATHITYNAIVLGAAFWSE